MTKKNLFKYLMPVGALLAFSSIASATLVAPGGNVTPTAGGTFGGTLLADTLVQVSTGSANLIVNYEEQVYSDPGNALCANCLDFVITATDSPTSNDFMERLTTSSFAGWTTDVSYVGAGMAPISATRTPDGATVGFNFPAINPGGSTATLIIKTDATAFVPGTLAFINNAVASGNGYGVAPEPNMAALLSVLAVGIIGIAYRKRKNVVKNTEA